MSEIDKTTAEDPAPYPQTIEQVTADALARYMAVCAHESGALNLPRFEQMKEAEERGVKYGVEFQVYMLNLTAGTAEQGLAFLLREVIEHLPEKADEIAARLWELWDDPPFVAWTWDVLQSYGIDPQAVSENARAKFAEKRGES